MRRFWPSSLYGQILLVAALAMLVAQLVNTAMLVRATNGRATLEASTMLVARVANQLERERLGDDRGRPLWERRGRTPSFAITIGSSPYASPDFPAQTELAARASEYLRGVDPAISSVQLSKGPISALPETLRAGTARRAMDGFVPRSARRAPEEAVILTLKLPNGSWLSAAAPVRTLGPFPPAALLVQTLILYLAVLIPLALVARRIVRPLKALTQRVGHAGFRGDGPPMEANGPSDVRELITAFNGAEARLSALLTEKDVMLGAIGHDLKTPLAALRVRIENVDDEAEREKMAASVDEMVVILDDILMLARVGKSAEQLQPTELRALVDTVISEFPDNAKIAFDAPTERHVVAIRPVLIRRALRNLVDNAVQYGGNADVQISQMDGQIRVIIDDNGPGIAADQLDTIFEPFARAGSSRNRASGGSGLGLTIARAIAQAHHGNVTLENRPERGARAILSFPV